MPLETDSTMPAPRIPCVKEEGTVAMKSEGTCPTTSEQTAAASPTEEESVPSEFNTEYSYEETDKLGEGSYATVFKCNQRSTGKTFAVKVVDKSKAGTAELHGVLHEVMIMKGLTHVNIISMHGHFEASHHIYLILDYVEGSTLFDRIIKSSHFSEEIAAGIFKNLIDGIEYLHSHNIIHRDLKPENLLMKRKAVAVGSPGYLDSMTEVVIADFGMATKSPGKACCGSPAYVAPEVLTGKEYGNECDLWSLGIVLYVMLAGAFPFKGPTALETFKAIKAQPLHLHPKMVWDRLSSDVMSFTSALLMKDPSLRMTTTEALRHPWVTGMSLKSPAPRTLHMEKSVTALKRFKLKEKVTTAMTVIKATRLIPRSTPDISEGSPLGAPDTDRTPIWKRYLQPGPELSLCFPVLSQTHRDKVNAVDLRLLLDADAAFRLQDLCNCPSEKVCRHVQYVYHHLFVGDRALDIPPHVTVVERKRLDVAEGCGEKKPSCTVLGTAAAALTSSVFASASGKYGVAVASSLLACAATYCSYSTFSAALFSAMCEFSDLRSIDDFLFAVGDFKRRFEAVPESDKKSILWLRPA
eukprot:TRINITY_DN192_c3_g1_i1.p1 TRINITY_DN192_c3_g1~~TRINITY_DN192_c3_g1_i1.p1  ORF type:complete len:603 (+),score=94.82 TRINITY_DN192_c3_g1_i1:68-1810(+)